MHARRIYRCGQRLNSSHERKVAKLAFEEFADIREVSFA